MRLPRIYENNYISLTRKYIEKGMQPPERLNKSFYAVKFIEGSMKWLMEAVAVSKEKWRWLRNIYEKADGYNGCSEDLYHAVAETVSILQEMYFDLEKNRELYFADGYTLKKVGRRRLRSAAEKAFKNYYVRGLYDFFYEECEKLLAKEGS